MIAWFCLECFSEVEPSARECPACGAAIPRGEADYETGLIRALRHPKLPDRQVLAAAILGKRRSARAIPDLIEVAREGPNPYLAAEAVKALDLIGGDEAEAAIRAFVNSPAFMVRSAALDAVARRDKEPPRADPSSLPRNPSQHSRKRVKSWGD